MCGEWAAELLYPRLGCDSVPPPARDTRHRQQRLTYASCTPQRRIRHNGVDGHIRVIWIGVLLTILVGPLALAAAGLFASRRPVASQPDHSTAGVTTTGILMLNSAVIYALSYNVIFFIQELFLVLPKALTPGLRPTLFHNNHSWSGDHPLASLFQGTGAVAIFVCGLVCLAILVLSPPRSPTGGLLLIWLAFHGLLQALLQVPLGVLSPGADVGMAMNYLGWSSTTRTVLALLALAAIVAFAICLTRPMLDLAAAPDQVSTRSRRSYFVFKAATCAAFIGTLLIIPFRIPRELIEVIGPPIFVAIVGLPCIQAAAWVPRSRLSFSGPVRAMAWPMVIALLFVFAVFHLVLARGVRFF